MPAFILTELKQAFIIGFIIFVPFLVIDIVVSGALMALGMMMMPPVMVSLPFKLLLFVMVDGWALVIKSLVVELRVGGDDDRHRHPRHRDCRPCSSRSSSPRRSC